VVSNAFLGIEIGHESGVSERLKRSETPVPSMVSRWFFGIDSNKACHSVALAEYYVERYFSSVVSLFSLRDHGLNILIVEDEPLLMKGFKRSEMFQKENDEVAKQPGTLQTVCRCAHAM